jgi:hypothetical protein
VLDSVYAPVHGALPMRRCRLSRPHAAATSRRTPATAVASVFLTLAA